MQCVQIFRSQKVMSYGFFKFNFLPQQHFFFFFLFPTFPMKVSRCRNSDVIDAGNQQQKQKTEFLSQLVHLYLFSHFRLHTSITISK